MTDEAIEIESLRFLTELIGLLNSGAHTDYVHDAGVRLLTKVRASERERCARVCENLTGHHLPSGATYAAAIRRGEG